MRLKLKQLAGQTLTYGLFTIFGRFLAFILFPLYINFMPKVEFADLVIVYSYIAFFNIFFSAAFESAFYRFYDKDNLDRSKEVFTHSFVSTLIFGSVISTIIFLSADNLTSIFSGAIDNSADIIRLAAFIPLLEAIQYIPYGLLRMTNNAKRFVIIKFVNVFIFLVLNIITIAVLGYGIFSVLINQIIALVITFIIHYKDIKFHLHFKYKPKLLKKMLAYGVPTVPAALSSIMLNVADKPVVKELMDADSAAVYGANYKLGIPMLLFVTAFEYAWRPFFLNNYKDEGSKELFSKILTYFALAGSLIFILVVFSLDYLIRIPFIGRGMLLPDDYWGGLGVIPIILLAYWFFGMYNNFSASLHIAKKTKQLAFSIVIGTIVYFIVMFLTIPHIGYLGAAWATVAGYFVNAVLIYLFSKRHYEIKYEWTKIFAIFGSAGLVYFIYDNLNLEYSTVESILVKLGLIIGFLLILKLFGFFNKQEINALKKLFKK